MPSENDGRPDMGETMASAVFVLTKHAQEFCARGVFQSSVERTMSGPRRVLWSVVTASVMFGAFHTFYSLPLALTSLAGRLLWGWLYHRHGTLLGVAISHFLIGNGLSVIDVGLFFIS
jgi:hypothetical protein